MTAARLGLARHLGGSRDRLLREPGLIAMVLAAATIYAVYSLVRNARFEAGFDLAIFDQAIRHYSEFSAPASSVRGMPNLLGDHFHPILVLLAPLYWVWSDPRALLIAQAVLVAASIVPVFLFARSKLDRTSAYAVAAAYAMFWGLQSGVGTDFHEVAFAPLLIALAILFGDRRRWPAFFVAVGALLLVKEDMAPLVCFFGIWLASRRDWKTGLITLVAGLGWYLLATQVFIPHFSPTGRFGYWTYGELGDAPGSALLNVVRHPWLPIEVGVNASDKTTTLALLFAPFLGLTLCSRIAILTIPLLAERLLSTNQLFWWTDFHYSLAIAPVLAMGAAAGLANVVRLLGTARAATLRTAVALALLPAAVAATAVAEANSHTAGRAGPRISRIFDPSFYEVPHSGSIDRALAHVPANASAAATDRILTHLSPRDRLTQITRFDPPVDYIVVNVLRPEAFSGPGSYHDLQAEVARRLRSFEPVFYEDGWIVLRRRGARGHAHALAPMSTSSAGRLDRSVRAWTASLIQYGSEGSRCEARLRSDQSGAAACYARAGIAFRREQARMLGALKATEGEQHTGCGALGRNVRAAVASLGSAIEAARAAGARRDFGEAARLSRNSVRLVERDVATLPRRYLLICRPLTRA